VLFVTPVVVCKNSNGTRLIASGRVPIGKQPLRDRILERNVSLENITVGTARKKHEDGMDVKLVLCFTAMSLRKKGE
jgi:hypothetical protein